MHRRPSANFLTARRPLAGRIALAILVAVCAVAAHQATYLLGFGGEGFGEAMGAGAHDGFWAPLVLIVLTAAAVLAAVALRELCRLSAHAAHLDGDSHPERERRAFAWATGALWLRLGLATTAVYGVQENVERVIAGQGPSGIDALAAHGLLPVLVILVASLAVAVVASLVRWRCEALLARLGRRAAPRRRPARAARSAVASRVHCNTPPAARGSRAPPVGMLAV